MSSGYPVRLAGEDLWLLPEKALYWPAQQALLIADVHFGKAAAYRSLGQPVPQGTTAANIEVLDRLLARLPCRQLIFLGDFLHGPGSHASGTLGAFVDGTSYPVTATITDAANNASSDTSTRPKSVVKIAYQELKSSMPRMGEVL